jgi:ribosomal protein S18 acetylase RimI-like enzyme
LIGDAVSQGAALGWVDPPEVSEVYELMTALAQDVRDGTAAAVVAEPISSPSTAEVLGVGFWRRYSRPTHFPQADLPLLVVDSAARRQGVGAAMLDELLHAARSSGVEQLTLDARGDNTAAHALWRSRGFEQYGVLPEFVAVADQRYDKTFWVADLRT